MRQHIKKSRIVLNDLQRRESDVQRKEERIPQGKEAVNERQTDKIGVSEGDVIRRETASGLFALLINDWC
jgi:hypothetical protein